MRLFLFLVILTCISATGANAKYSFCNKTSYALSAAVGYVDGDRLATRGWWRLRPGQCKVVLTEQTNPGQYFVYAEAIPGHKGELRTWSGDTGLCVENFGFFNLRNQEVCRDDPLRKRKFFDVNVTEEANGNWQTDFAEAKLGFFYCNKTDNPVWSAIAEPEDEDSYRSRGWWRLEPGDCAKIIKGELQHDHYYIYGAIEEGLNEHRINNGDKTFCINAVMFDAKDDLSCADQDLDGGAFRRIEIGGSPSATFEFLPGMFTAPPTE